MFRLDIFMLSSIAIQIIISMTIHLINTMVEQVSVTKYSDWPDQGNPVYSFTMSGSHSRSSHPAWSSARHSARNSRSWVYRGQPGYLCWAGWWWLAWLLAVQQTGSIHAFKAFGIEFMITLVLVLVVFAAAADSNNSTSVKGSAPLAIGLSITTCHLFAIPLTGSSMNPARSLGPSVVAGCWNNHWVYWAGPVMGGVTGALLYQLVFQVRNIQSYLSIPVLYSLVCPYQHYTVLCAHTST